MYKLLIADDEEIIRKGIIKSHDWKQLGFDQIFEAADGLEALELIKENYPHVVLTDVRMPNMDGIQLVKHALEIKPDMKIIILSGYDDFSYAQSAIKMGAKDYILKPTRIKDIISSVARVMEEIEKEDRNNIKIFQGFLTDLINKRIPDIEARKKELGIKIQDSDLRVVIFKPMGNKNISWNKLNDHALIRFCICNILIEVFEGEDTTVFEDNLGNIVAFININNYETVKFTEFVDNVKLTIEESMGIFVTTGIGTVCDSLENINISYQNALVDISKQDGSDVCEEEYLSDAIVLSKKYIEENLTDDISLNKVAKYVNMSPNYFSGLFRRETNESFSGYIAKIRIMKAKALFRKKDLKVYEVGELVGYDNPRYFSQFFKKHTGVTISEYRQQFNIKEN